ncbi:hypothetical protein BH11MYX3_BH11MYX3_29470 [soil metagenome]
MRCLAVVLALAACSGSSAESTASEPSALAIANPPVVQTPPVQAPPPEPEQVAYIDPDDGGEIAGAPAAAEPPGIATSHGVGVGTGMGTASVGNAGPGGGPRYVQSTPQVRLGKATVTGKLDPAIVERHIRRYLSQVRSCYEKRLSVDPSTSGLLVAKLRIESTGKVITVTASGVHAEVEACVVARARTWEFPKPASGVVEVTQPYAFAPS